jgi:hypothetical protein
MVARGGSGTEDVQKLSLRAPDGMLLAENATTPLPRDQAQSILYAGSKRRAEGWLPGAYSARYTVRAKAKRQSTNRSCCS